MKVLHDRCSINCEGGLMSSFLMVGPAMASIKSVLTRPAGFEMTRLLAQSPGCNAPLVSSYLTNGLRHAKKIWKITLLLCRVYELDQIMLYYESLYVV